MLISSIYRRPKVKDQVAVKRYNKMVLRRKLRLASFVPAPRLVKQ